MTFAVPAARNHTFFPLRALSSVGLALVLVLSQATGPGQPRLHAAVGDQDNDGLPDQWEQDLGLDPSSSAPPNGTSDDPDHDGATNLQEYQAGTHPRGFASRYLAEGASGYFSTTLALSNPDLGREAHVLVRFLNDDATTVSTTLRLGAGKRVTILPATVAGVRAAYSTVVDSDAPVAVDRVMQWGTAQDGLTLESGAETSSTQWYFAEGATHSGFQLFYLLQNPNSVTATVTATYLRPSPNPPVTRTYNVRPKSRLSIWINVDEPALALSDVAARFSSNLPIVAERAMYTRAPSGAFRAGHAALGVPAPAARWYFGEGATGFFDAFLLLANPTSQSTDAKVTYLVQNGAPIVKIYTVPPTSRRTVWVNLEDPQLATASMSFIVESTNGARLVAERAMWWQSLLQTPAWYEGHVAAGSTATGLRWALAASENNTAPATATYVLVANTSAVAARTRVSILPEGNSPAETRELSLPPYTRTTLYMPDLFPWAATARYGVSIESLAPQQAGLVVEQALYRTGTQFWSGGGAAAGAELPSPVLPLSDANRAPNFRAFTRATADAAHLVTGTIFSVTQSAPSVANVTINASTGVVRLAPRSNAQGTTTITVTATQPNGQTFTTSFLFTVGPLSITFGPTTTVQAELFPAIADIDGDGWVEPLGGRNDRTGRIVPVDLTSAGLASLKDEATRRVNRDTRIADFTGDGLPDILTNTYPTLNNSDIGQSHFYVNRGNYTFQEDLAFAALRITGSGETIVAADFDNDGDLDAFIPFYAHNPPNSRCYLLVNDGAGHFTDVADQAGVALRTQPAPLRVEGAQAVDINRDGLLDLYVASHLFINQGGMTFVDRAAQYGLPQIFDEGAKFLDWNNDGWLDLVLQAPTSGPVLFEFDGTTFVQKNVFPSQVYFDAFGLTIGDLNNDGYEDVVPSGGDGNDTPVFENTGTGFSRASATGIDTWGNDALALGDFNRDGKLDIAKRVNPTLIYTLNTTSGGNAPIVLDVVGSGGEHNQQGRTVQVWAAAQPATIYSRIVDGGSGLLAQGQYEVFVTSESSGAHKARVWFASGPVDFDVQPGDRKRVFPNGTMAVLP